MKVKIPLRQSNRLLNHGPLVLVSCAIDGDRPNCLPVAWVMPVSHEPSIVAMVIGKGNYSFKWIRKNKSFVINIPPVSIMDKVMRCGGISGSDTDKFKEVGLTAIKSDSAKAPLISECIGHLECEVIEEKSLIEKYNIFLGKVLSAWVEKEAFEEVWKLDRDDYRTYHHLGGNTFVLDGEVRKLI
jgi:flavin reductase (DIM6/NTAB) family NADH-FMN oxidoreductase RutF